MTSRRSGTSVRSWRRFGRSQVAQLIFAAASFSLLLAATAFSIGGVGSVSVRIRPVDESFDVRNVRAKIPVSSSARVGIVPRPNTMRALTRLSKNSSQVIESLDPLTGTIQDLVRWKGELRVASKTPLKKSVTVWLKKHFALVGIDKNDVKSLHLVATDRFPGGDVRFTWNQFYRGIPAYDNHLIVYTANHQISQISGSPNRNLKVKSVKPKITAAKAVGLLIKSLPFAARRHLKLKSHSHKATHTTLFSGNSRASLKLFNLGRGKTILAWQITYAPVDALNINAVVDARTGRLLKRFNNVSMIKANVWDTYPGATVGGTVHSVDLSQWVDDFDTTGLFSSKNNFVVLARLLNSDPTDFHFFTPQTLPVQGDSLATERDPFFGGPLFGCPAVGCSWAPGPNGWKRNMDQSAVQLFYFANEYIDHLASKPIDFQFNSAGGLMLLVLDFSGSPTTSGETEEPSNFNNAAASSSILPNGDIIRRIDFYLFRRDSSNPSSNWIYPTEDASIVFHELTHLMSFQLNRLAMSTGSYDAAAQANAINEALSDWFSVDFELQQHYLEDSDAPGEVSIGQFSTDSNGGLRTQPLDCPVGTAAKSCSRNGVSSTIKGNGGYTYSDFGKISVSGTEPHADGEIIGETLLDLRRVLVKDLGENVGETAVQTLITAAIARLPENPTYLDLRDAILAANKDGKIEKIIWAVFAHRGMGVDARAGELLDPLTDYRNYKRPVAGFSKTPQEHASNPETPRRLSGTLDGSFGNDGKRTLEYHDLLGAAAPTHLTDVATQADGKIVITGSADHKLLVWRLNSNGSYDETFGDKNVGQGSVVWEAQASDPNLSQSKGVAIAIQNDGKIDIAGTVGHKLAVWRFNSDGHLDASFGNSGVFTYQDSDPDGTPVAMDIKNIALQKNRILICGYAGTRFMWGVTYSGELDKTFANNGVKALSAGNQFKINKINVLSSQKIYVTGAVPGTAFNIVMRLNEDGSKDTSFQTQSLSGGSLSGGPTSARDTAITQDGKMVITGEVQSAMFVWRLLPNSDPDNSLGTDGSVSRSSGEDAQGKGVVVQSNGKIVVTGRAGNNFHLWRLNKDGSFDESFVHDGDRTIEVRSPHNDKWPSEGNAIVMQSDGKYVVVGNANHRYGFVWRFNNYDS